MPPRSSTADSCSARSSRAGEGEWLRLSGEKDDGTSRTRHIRIRRLERAQGARIQKILAAPQAGVDDPVPSHPRFGRRDKDPLRIEVGVQDEEQQIVTLVRLFLAAVQTARQSAQLGVV